MLETQQHKRWCSNCHISPQITTLKIRCVWDLQTDEKFIFDIYDNSVSGPQQFILVVSPSWNYDVINGLEAQW